MVSPANLHPSDDKSMTPEQFNQVVSAILDGKYSWACVLILRFAGYNPLHYVPYRTYNRLMKENGQFHRMATKGRQENQARSFNHKNKKGSKSLKNAMSSKASSKISDLNHLEDLSARATHIRGGFSAIYTPVLFS